MEDLGQAFEGRLLEIEAYLQLLEGIEVEARSGPPRLGESGPIITVQQQRILYSAVFLHLYNLVEATIVRCLDGITEAALTSGRHAPGDLTGELRREWVRVMARTHTDLNYENRLVSALGLCDHLVEALPVSGFKVEKGGGGNWDDTSIEEIAVRLGFHVSVSADVYSSVKRKVRDDLGPLGLVRKLRNDLAHGSISFAECGENLTAGELRNLVDMISKYIREVVELFVGYINDQKYLVPAKRSVVVAV